MPTDRNGDGLNALLREALQRSSAGPVCPDAETVAAWHDGVLSRADARAVELHVADCPRCRALVANLLRSEPPAEALVEPLWRRWRLQWVVPLAATASAVAIWIAVPSRDASPPPMAASTISPPAQSNAGEQLPSQRENREALRQEQESVAPQAAARMADRPAVADADASGQQKSSSASGDAGRPNAPLEGSRAALAAAPPAPAAALPPPAAPPAPTAAQPAVEPPVPARDALDALRLPARNPGGPGSRVLAETARVAPVIVIASPDLAVRWRVLPGAIEVSRTAGALWIAAALPDTASAASVIAGHAPDGQTCWLVGRRGLVLRSTDSVTFVRVPFEPTVDLVSVRAQNGQQAVVTTVDGRQFGTADGGASWAAR